MKLNQISQEYNRFRDNQVLTASELNKLIDFMESQNRLTRTCLSGVGIICGMTLSFDSNNQIISVKKGCGVTTDGDLIYLSSDKAFLEVSPFEDKKARYPAFWQEETQRFQLWELLDGTEDEDREKIALSDFSGQTNIDLVDTVVLAYLENYPKTEDLCTPLDCDNQGEPQVARLRFLLIKASDARIIIDEIDSLYKKYGNQLKEYFRLPNLKASRVVINGKNAASLGNMINAFTTTITNQRESLLEALTQLAGNFGDVLDPNGEVDSNLWLTHFDNVFPTDLGQNVQPLAFQYRYDHFQDLMKAYLEVRTELFNVLVECLPEINAFPHHLMLGGLQDIEAGSDIDFRHQFYPSPVNTQNERRLLQCQSLYRRLHLMMLQYVDPLNRFKNLKVTPSKIFDSKLSEGAIPYFYEPSVDLVKDWDYDKQIRGQSEEVLSYHADQYTSDQHVLNPLNFEHDDEDFYRIEGHIGQSYGDVIDDLKKIRTEKGLSFDIMALSIGNNQLELNLEDYKFYFNDLEALLDAWRAEQACITKSTSRFFSGFRIDEDKIGTHQFYTPNNVLFNPGTRRDPVTITFPGGNPGGNISGNVIFNPNIGSFNPNTGPFIGGPFISPQNLTGTVDRGSILANNIKGDNIFTTGSGLILQDKNVRDGLVDEEGVLGKPILGIIDTKLGTTAADWRDLILTEIYDKIENINDITQDNLRVGLEIPVDIITKLQYLTDQQPGDLSEITPQTIENYKQAISSLVKAVQNAKQDILVVLNREEYELKGYEEDYLLLLNQLELNTCAAKKMEALMEEFIRRQSSILELQKLSKFSESHPGMIHKGGVPKEGTFIVVYKDESPPKDSDDTSGTLTFPKLEVLRNLSRAILPANFTSPQFNPSIINVQTQKLATQRGFSFLKANQKTDRPELISRPDEFAKYVIDNHQILNIDNALRDYKQVTGINNSLTNLVREAIFEGIIFQPDIGPEPNVSRFTVVADFYLPYRCCSDLPPMVFVLPQQLVSLRLPVAFICIKEDDEEAPAKLPFEVVPADGIIEADVAVDGLIIREEDRPYLDPSVITESLYGKTITFKVNGQNTNLELRIYRKPKAIFEVSPKPIIDKGDVIIQDISIQNATEEKAGENLKYQWDFGDGSQSSEKNPNHSYKFTLFELEQEKNVTVRLTVTNGECSDRHEESFIVDISSLITVDEECREEALDTISKDREATEALTTGSLFQSRRSDFVKNLNQAYKELDPDAGQLDLYLSGRQNIKWISIVSELISSPIIETNLSAKSNKGEDARKMSVYILRLLLIVIKCQENLKSSTELDQMLNKFNSIFVPMKKRFDDFFEEGDRDEPLGLTLRKYLAEYLETTKIKDLRTIKRIQTILNSIS